MGDRTAIEWCDATWNPWQGCTHVSPGCNRCYMYAAKRHYGQNPGRVVRSSEQTWRLPRRLAPGTSVFACSWSDWWHPDADEWRDEAWEEIRRHPDLRFLLLTKRPERILGRLPADWYDGWPQVGIGVTAEDQERADERVPILLDMPAAMRFVSVEPILEPIDMLYAAYTGTESVSAMGGLDWLIAGAESGPARRPSDDDWFRSLREQCETAGVPYFFKGRGQPARPGNDVLDDRTWHERPAWLEVSP